MDQRTLSQKDRMQVLRRLCWRHFRVAVLQFVGLGALLYLFLRDIEVSLNLATIGVCVMQLPQVYFCVKTLTSASLSFIDAAGHCFAIGKELHLSTSRSLGDLVKENRSITSVLQKGNEIHIETALRGRVSLTEPLTFFRLFSGIPWNQTGEAIIRFPVTPAMQEEEILKALGRE